MRTCVRCAACRPLNRGLWWDFPTDHKAWSIDDQYMFGDDYIMAPVLEPGAQHRSVYLPTAGGAQGPGTVQPQQWKHVFTGKTYSGGATYDVAAPPASFPLFKRL